MSYRTNAVEPEPPQPWWRRWWRVITLYDYRGPPLPELLPPPRDLPADVFLIPGVDPTTVALTVADARRAVVAHNTKQRPEGNYEERLEMALKAVLEKALEGQSSVCVSVGEISEPQTRRLMEELRFRGYQVEGDKPPYMKYIFIKW